MVLITSSRMPFALGMVRMLAAEGHAVYAADDHSLSPGSHSKYLAGHFVYPSPRSDLAIGAIGAASNAVTLGLTNLTAECEYTVASNTGLPGRWSNAAVFTAAAASTNWAAPQAATSRRPSAAAEDSARLAFILGVKNSRTLYELYGLAARASPFFL